MRRWAALIATVTVLAACSGGGGDADGGDASTSTTVGSSVTTGSSPQTGTVPPAVGSVEGPISGVVLARALVQSVDLAGFEVRTAVRPFDATQRAGLLVCGVDLRAETGETGGVQAVFVRDRIQITATVTATDAAGSMAFVDRFGALVDTCDGPWSQEAAQLGDDALDAEILGPVDLGDPGVPFRAVRIRTTSAVGSSDVVAAILAVGPVLSAVTVAGPVDDPLGDATDAVAAAARRAGELASQLG